MKGTRAAGLLVVSAALTVAACSPDVKPLPSNLEPTPDASPTAAAPSPSSGLPFDVVWERQVAVPGAASGITGAYVIAGGPGFVAYGATIPPGTKPTNGGSPQPIYLGIWTSADGRSWTQVADARFAGAAGSCAASTGGTSIAVGDSGGSGGAQALWSSPDGASWDGIGPADLGPFCPLAFANGRLVGLAGRAIEASYDGGATWHPADTPDLAAPLTVLAATPFGFVGMDTGGPGRTPAVFVSANGARWTRASVDLSGLRGLYPPIMTASGVLIVGTSDAPAGSDVVSQLPHQAFLLESTDGVAWSRKPAGRAQPMAADVVNAATSDAGRTLVLGSVDGRPAMWTSPDGVRWRETALPPGADGIASVALAGGAAVGVGWDAKNRVPEFWVGRVVPAA